MWIKLLCVRVLFPMGSSEFFTIYGHQLRHWGHVCCMLDSDWQKKLLCSGWLGLLVASFTTGVDGFVSFSQ